MPSIRLPLIRLAVFATLVTASQIAAAQDKVGTVAEGKASCGTSARIVEHTTRPANVDIRLTDNGQNFIFAVQVQTHVIPGRNGAFSDPFDVPAGFMGGIACDAHNYTVVMPPSGAPLPPVDPNPPLQPPVPAPGGGAGGPASLLYIESLIYDPDAHLLELEGVFDQLVRGAGSNATVRIPDLFADTNEDGLLGDGDALYSLVELGIYLRSVPSFDLNDTFSIVNGRVATLPGMIFSTTPFTFDPTLLSSTFGDVNLGGVPGFVGTPAYGMATLLAIHEVTSIPEPATPLLFAVALAGLAMCAGIRRHAVICSL